MKTRTPGQAAHAAYLKSNQLYPRPWKALSVSSQVMWEEVGQAVLTEYFDLKISVGGAPLDTTKRAVKSNKSQNTKSK